LLGLRSILLERLQSIASLTPAGALSRIHGDYHLGQVLIAQNDVVVIDFEGEPQRSLPERRTKTTPMRDVAGMVRSLDYAAAMAVLHYGERNGASLPAIEERMRTWRDSATTAFLDAYRTTMAGCRTYPDDPKLAYALLEHFLLQKVIYETGYELANRPDWVTVPLRGAIEILTTDTTGS